MTATTALTAQNTTGVFDVHHVPPAFLRRQIEACVGDIGVDVVKTGMLASAETIAAVADAVGELELGVLVVDPVMVATSGSRLLPAEAVRVLREKLLPKATVLTPNLPEAVLLLEDAGWLGRREVRGLGDLEEIARAVRELGPEWVLVKGGHCPLRRDGVVARADNEREAVVDVLCGGPEETVIRFETPYHDSRNTHGTGCSLACELDLAEKVREADWFSVAAIASNLANGSDIPRAVKLACRYVEAAIKTAPVLGKGNGPLNHFHSTYTLQFSSWEISASWTSIRLTDMA